MLTIFYDNRCPICLRTKSVLERIDWWNNLLFVGIRNKTVFSHYPALDEASALQRMASLQHAEIIYGFESVFRIVRTLPILWIFAPLFYLLRWTKTGEKIYDEIALKRKLLPASCDESCVLSE